MNVLRRPGPAIATLLIILMGATFLTQVVPYGQILDSRRQVASARAELTSLQTENVALQSEVEALHTDGEIEKLAREKLGYVRPGETAYVVLDPPGTPADPETPAPAPVETDKTWVDRIWEFLSGADISS